MNDLWISTLFRWLCAISLIFSGAALAALETGIETGSGSVVEGSADTRDFLSAPSHLQTYGVKPSVAVSIDNSLAMLKSAYDTKHFDPQSGDGQIGYFRADKQYYYNSKKHFFYSTSTKGNQRIRDEHTWDGRYLNWLTMRRVDIAKEILTGGAIRLLPATKSKSKTVLQAYVENTYEDKIHVAADNSHQYSPVLNKHVVTVSKGKFSFGSPNTKTFNIRVEKENTPKGLLQNLNATVDFNVYIDNAKFTGSLADSIQSINHLSLDPAPYSPYFGKQLSLLSSCQSLTYINVLGSSLQLTYVDGIDNPMFEFALNELDALPEALKYHGNERSKNRIFLGGGTLHTGVESGEGVLYQSSYSPSISSPYLSSSPISASSISTSSINTPIDGSPNADLNDAAYAAPKEVNWVGDLSALMVDSLGRIRSDNGDGTLGSPQADPIVDTCYDESDQVLRVRLSRNEAARPSGDDSRQCSKIIFSHLKNDIGYIWQASQLLSKLNSLDVVKQRQTYSSDDQKRYIRTHIAKRVFDFTEDSFPDSHIGLLNINNTNDAGRVINFVRGLDQPGLRSRQISSETKRLGDFINSTPVAVSAPAENLHLIYDDDSYLDFFKQYRGRRTVIYLGGNDGMLHAFNGGWYDKQGLAPSAHKKRHTKWSLGQEIWAFVPYNILPHLKYLSSPSYGKEVSDHVYLLDQSAYVFDAKIFSKKGISGQADRSFYDSSGMSNGSETHPNGWGTVLVIGFGKGGGNVEIYSDPSKQKETLKLRPAYLIFDITDPEQEPKLLAEFSHKQLGASFSSPTALSLKNSQGDYDWFLAFGSGPSSGLSLKSSDNDELNGESRRSSGQHANLFMLNLKTMGLESSFGHAGVMDLHTPNAFVGDISAADFDFNASTDALYFGSSSLKQGDTKEKGKLFRLRINPGSKGRKHQWKYERIVETPEGIQYKPQLGFDQKMNRWLLFSSRPFQVSQSLLGRPLSHLYGVKEARLKDGSFVMDDFTKTPNKVKLSNLTDVSKAQVDFRTGKLSGSVHLSPKLAEDTVMALERRQFQYQEKSTYQSGWFKQLSDNEYVTGGGALLGGKLSQTSYTLKKKECRLEGQSSLYTLRHTTGTAWYDENTLSGGASEAITGANQENITDIPLGKLPSPGPLIHLGELRKQGKASIINLSRDGVINSYQEENLGSLNSQEISWREL